MSIICGAWGHNWVLRADEDVTAHWKQCVRCGRASTLTSGGAAARGRRRGPTPRNVGPCVRTKEVAP